jgi:hypothetical protein
MAQIPRLLGCLDPAVLDEAALVIKGLQRLGHRRVGQEDGWAAWSVVLALPLPHGHRLDGVGLAVATGGVASMLRGALWVIGRQAGDPDHLRLQAFGPRCAALPMAPHVHPAAHRDVLPSRGLSPGICRHRQSLQLQWHLFPSRVARIPCKEIS